MHYIRDGYMVECFCSHASPEVFHDVLQLREHLRSSAPMARLHGSADDADERRRLCVPIERRTILLCVYLHVQQRVGASMSSDHSHLNAGSANLLKVLNGRG